MSELQVTVYGGGGRLRMGPAEEAVREELTAAVGDGTPIRWRPAPEGDPNAQSVTIETAAQVALVFAGTGFAASFFSEAGKDAWAASKRLAAAIWSRLQPSPEAGGWTGYWVTEVDGARVAVRLSPQAPNQAPTPDQIEESIETARRLFLMQGAMAEQELRKAWVPASPGEDVVYVVVASHTHVHVWRSTSGLLD